MAACPSCSRSAALTAGLSRANVELSRPPVENTGTTQTMGGSIGVFGMLPTADKLLDKLTINKKVNVALHLGCSARKMKLEPKMQAIANACSAQVLKPAGIECCGYAGEKGLYKPEINASALRNIKKLIPVEVKEGYYANRMCEVGLTQHSGISYRHLAYLLEECSR